jgi:hypothetical protein
MDQGVPVPTKSARLSEWLPYWVHNIVKPGRKLSTYDKYEAHVRLYLVPLLGSKRLESLGVADVRRFIVRLEQQTTAATVKEAHRVLRSALSSACREELITRNVAKLVEPPRTGNRELQPWTLDETLDFRAASRKDPLYAAFVLAIAMGLRRGEIGGLRRSDLDLDHRVLYVRQQTQRGRGVLYDDDPRVVGSVPCRAVARALHRAPALVLDAAGSCSCQGGGDLAGVGVRLHHPYGTTGRAAERLSLLHARRRVRRPPCDPAARRPARHRDPPHGGRGGSPAS